MGVVVLRGLIVLGLLGSAWVHLDLWLLGYRDIETIGPLFLVNVVAGVVIAIGVACWRHWLPALAAAGFGAVTLGAFLLSVTVGLFGMQGVWTGTPQLLAALAEVVCVLGGGSWLLVMARERGAR
ncbi:hypothetical protein [Amycolatopsis aidingensis]|uniref:hypothetical protein n=1 Tax=Amycolatopsis aidingensis TaxID=2842453 RepID=UPI001C0D7997|nr:hypothetical protein [Amycolatopsis aidingensis]